MLNNFHLKIIACVTMFIDHLAIALYAVHFSAPWFDYNLMRNIGRIAFPLFAFMIASGAFYTKNKIKYALRLLLFAIISEVPFNLVAGSRVTYTNWQNVYFTLLAGLICVFIIQFVFSFSLDKKRHIALRIFLPIISIVCIGAIAYCNYLFKSDYGYEGVLSITIFGLGIQINELLKKSYSTEKQIIWNRRFIDLICAVLVAMILTWVEKSEFYSIFAVIPIFLYNYKRGFSNKIVQYCFYAFYPVHLLVVYGISLLV